MVASFVAWLVLCVAQPIVVAVLAHSSFRRGLVYLLPVLLVAVLVAGLLLTIVPRTRAFGGGLLIGLVAGLVVAFIVLRIAIRSMNLAADF